MNFNLARTRAENVSVPTTTKRARAILFLSVISWLSLVSVGLWLIWGYENTPGLAAESPRQWPADSRIQPAQDHATLVMLAHPHCPCTRASIGELASIMAHSQGRLSAYVLFLKPAGSSDDWEKTDLWQSAADIPGVKRDSGRDGTEARLFHAATSAKPFFTMLRAVCFSAAESPARADTLATTPGQARDRIA